MMEHPLEAERLELKTRKERILEELKLLPLRAGMDVLDVGCGTGAVSRILAENVSPGKVVGVDFSEERLRAAEATVREKGLHNLTFIRRDVRDLGSEEGSFDLAFSRFLFQYLPEEEGLATLTAMKQLVRPGGTVCVADLDGNTLYRYPLDPEWEEILAHLHQELQKTGFDPYVGRKLFWMFSRCGFRDIQVNIMPYYLIAGRADPTTLRIWEMKIQILENTLEKIFTSKKKARGMAERFMEDLRSEEVLLYSLLFLVQAKV